MTVKVVRAGNSIFPLQIMCLACGSLLEVESATDLMVAMCNSIPAVLAPSIWCPFCKERVFLYEADRKQALAEFNKV